MSYVRSRGSQREQSLDLGVSIVRSEVQVQAILRRLRLRDRHEKESRKPVRCGSDLELVGVVVHDNSAERVSPPQSEGTRVARIDDRLFPLEAHEPIVEKPRDWCAQKTRVRGLPRNGHPHAFGRLGLRVAVTVRRGRRLRRDGLRQRGPPC